MPTVAQFVIGAVLLTGTCVLLHYFYGLIKTPEKATLGLETLGTLTWGQRIYLSLVVLTWLAFAYSGAYGLVRHVSKDLADIAAVLLAMGSLALLQHFETAARAFHGYRRNLLVLRELEAIITRAYSPTEGEIASYEERAKTGDSALEREKHEDVARFAAALAKRDAKLCENALANARRDAEKAAEERKQVEAQAQKTAQLQSYRARLEATVASAAHQLTVAKTIDAGEIGEDLLLEPIVVKEKLMRLHTFGERILKAGKSAPIAELLQSVMGVRTLPGVTYTLRLEGTERDGYCEVESTRTGSKGDLVDGLAYEASLDGLTAALYFQCSLARQLSWGHGRYDRDQRLVLVQSVELDILEQASISPDRPELKTLTTPAGIRVRRNQDGSLAVSCLAHHPGRGLFDYEVVVSNGVASRAKFTPFFVWGQGILY